MLPAVLYQTKTETARIYSIPKKFAVQQHPSGSMREHILQVCNTQLSECAASEKSFRESEQAAGSASRRGVAFVKASETLRKSARMVHVCQSILIPS